MSDVWDRRFMDLARLVGGWSKDRSRRIGCVIVGPDQDVRAIGYNGFPRGIDDAVSSRHARPAKYLWTEHAERNAIYNAARAGTPLKGCTIYVPWFPCVDCSRAIVQVGAVRLVAFKPDLADPQWGDQFAIASELLEEAGLIVSWYDQSAGSNAASQD